jgi:glycosyltransferase involved in cell wall biosynthesis
MEHQFVLITAAKNEESYIGEAMRSVLRQTVRPAAWFIVDDGSSDNTAGIVREFAEKAAWIHLCSSRERGGRNFGSQYKAIQSGYELAHAIPFSFIGVQDADIAPEKPEYYETMLQAFTSNPRLGIAGGYIYERSRGLWKSRKSNAPDSVAGGVQMFRKECFEKIGGYTPLPLGGSDWLAQINARIAGWDVQAFPSLAVFHFRPTSSAGGRLRGHFRMGLMDASFGSNPAFEILKCSRRIGASPPLLGAALRLAGYAWWKMKGRPPLIGAARVAFLQEGQRAKVSRFLKACWRRSRIGNSASRSSCFWINL